MSDDESCPLCLEAFDATDRSFHPCYCGYQICLYCFHRLKQDSPKCPACRKPYPKEVTSSQPNEILKKAIDEEQTRLRESKERELKERKQRQATAISSNGYYSSHPGEKILQNVRVRQRNLVYVVGLPPSVAQEDILRKKEYFGKFGKILKISIISKIQAINLRKTATAYIAYKREQDAMQAIKETNSSIIEGRIIKAAYGTTKYCSFFLRNQTCNNPTCAYLHELAQEVDCFAKEESNNDRFNEDSYQESSAKSTAHVASSVAPSFRARSDPIFKSNHEQISYTDAETAESQSSHPSNFEEFPSLTNIISSVSSPTDDTNLHMSNSFSFSSSLSNGLRNKIFENDIENNLSSNQ